MTLYPYQFLKHKSIENNVNISNRDFGDFPFEKLLSLSDDSFSGEYLGENLINKNNVNYSFEGQKFLVDAPFKFGRNINHEFDNNSIIDNENYDNETIE